MNDDRVLRDPVMGSLTSTRTRLPDVTSVSFRSKSPEFFIENK